MPILRVDNPTMVAELIADLQRSGIVATAVGPDTVSIGILGSYNADAHRMAIWLRLRAWERSHRARGVDVRVEID